MSGVGIDGEVLSYLELAQVGLWALISHPWCVSHKPTLTLIKTYHCPIHLNTDVTEVCFYTGKSKEYLEFGQHPACRAAFETRTPRTPSSIPVCPPEAVVSYLRESLA